MLRYFLLAAACSILSYGQSPGQTLISAGQNALPGTLAEFHDARSPVTATFNGQNSSNPQLITKKVDLSKTVEIFAAKKKLSLTQARLDAFMFLGLVPRASGLPSPDGVKFKKVATDVFEITATENYFRRLPAMQRCLELGKKQVVIEVQTFAIAPSESDQLAKLITPGTLKVHYDRIPNVSPVATNDALAMDEFEPFVSTSTVTRQNIPVTTGQLSAANLARLHKLIESSNSASVLSNPTLSALPGQAATISDMTFRPFVVGADVTAEFGEEVFASPTVQAIEQGTTVRVKALPVNGQIQLMTDIAISRIMAVDVFRSPLTEENSVTTIQLPSQRIRQVHLARVVNPGTTILIDPNLAEPLPSKKVARGKPAERRFLVALTARIVDMDAADPLTVASSRRP